MGVPTVLQHDRVRVSIASRGVGTTSSVCGSSNSSTTRSGQSEYRAPGVGGQRAQSVGHIDPVMKWTH